MDWVDFFQGVGLLLASVAGMACLATAYRIWRLDPGVWEERRSKELPFPIPQGPPRPK